MKPAPYYNVNKLLCSSEGEAGAARLLEKLRNGELEKRLDRIIILVIQALWKRRTIFLIADS